MSSAVTVVTGKLVRQQHVEQGWLIVDGGRIIATGNGNWSSLILTSDDRLATIDPTAVEVVDAGDGWVIAGLVDIHCHGANGQSMDDGSESACVVADFHRSQGTTTLIASLISGSSLHMVDAVRDLAALVSGTTLAGLHLEGPYLSPKRRGAHDATNLRLPDVEEVERLLDVGNDAVRMMTLAPELSGALDLIDLLVGRGIVAAVGHTDATAEQCRAAVDHGASVATHLFNGMPPLLNRGGGAVAQLAADDRVSCELIHDGHHVDDDVLRLCHRLFGPGRLLLVSDASSPTGCPDGHYRLGEEGVVLRDGIVETDDGRSLAGSARPLLAMLAHAIEIGLPVVAAVGAATWAPAQALSLVGRGTLEPGSRADVVIVGADWQLRRVMAEGVWQEAAPPRTAS